MVEAVKVKSAGFKSGDLILLTGASGFVAGHVLNSLLDSGYRVRCTVRSKAKFDEILRARGNKDVDRLEYVIVQDIAQDGAFDEAVKGVAGVIHTASPFLFTIQDNKTELLDPAINGTVGILKSITKNNPGVRRVVITSSFAAMTDITKGARPGYTYSEPDWNPITYDYAITASAAEAYRASKTFAERAAFKYVNDPAANTTNFTVTTLCPPYVYGPIVHPVSSIKHLNTSSALIYDMINKTQETAQENFFGGFVDARDLGVAHVRALEREGREGEEEDRYLCAAGTFTGRQICDIIRRNFPELVAAGRVPRDGEEAEMEHYEYDSGKIKRELGVKFRGLEECVVDVVKDLLKLEEREKGRD
ncbi:methylglyoxal reductase (NADPH-dependent) gre2 [Rhizina undulata]